MFLRNNNNKTKNNNNQKKKEKIIKIMHSRKLRNDFPKA